MNGGNVRARIVRPTLAWVIISAFAAGSLSPRWARADDAPQTSSEAERLFREGRAAMRAGDLPSACARFAESQTIAFSPGTVLNLAICEDRIGKLRAAQRHYQAFLQAVPATDDRRDVANSALASLLQRMPRLQVKLAPEWPVDTEVMLDGEPLAVSDRESVTSPDPGVHTVSVRSISKNASREVDVDLVASAEPQYMTIGLIAPPEPVAMSAPAREPEVLNPAPLTPLRTAGLVTMGAGALGLGVGVAFVFRALAKKADSDQGCDGNACWPAAKEDRLAAMSAGDAATIAFFAGAALSGTGLVLYLWGRPSSIPPTIGSIRLTPAVSPSTAGGVLAGTF